MEEDASEPNVLVVEAVLDVSGSARTPLDGVWVLQLISRPQIVLHISVISFTVSVSKT